MTSRAAGEGYLDGRVAIVTGGGRGLGAALARGLAAAGAQVVLAGRQLARCQEVVEKIQGEGGQASAIAADISVTADRCRLISHTVDAFGGIDVLVNNAAILKPHLVLKVTEDELDEIWAVNLKGPVLLAQAAHPHLRAGGGVIVNVAAAGAFQPMAGIGAYSAAKAALVNWTSTMAKEWAPDGIRVNNLVPGPVATDMILPRDAERRVEFESQMSAQTLVGRLAAPEDLAAAVVFLCSDQSAFMTGRSLFMDGGLLA